jgi:signal transduction histidine kinase
VSLVVLGYLVGGLLGLALTWYAFDRREEATVRSFGYLTLVAALICLALAGRLLTTDPSLKLVWNLLAYVGWVSIGPAILVFSLRFVGAREWTTRRLYAALAVVPAMTLPLVAVSPWVRLHYTTIGLRVVDGWPILRTVVGPWFWVHALYEYGLILFGIFLLARYALGASEPFRTQSVVLAGSFLFMTVVNVVYLLSGFAPFPGADLTPLGIVVGLCVVAVAIFRVRLVDVVPVARDRVFSALDDAVVVVDAEGRVVDVNDAATELLDTSGAGHPVGETLPRAAIENGVHDGSVESTEFPLRVDGDDRWYLVRRQWVDDGAFALIFTDVTERRTREERLEEFASVVSHDLRNPLSVARAHVELATETDDPDPHLAEADDALGRIDHIVDELLTLAREGDAITDPSPVDLERVAWDAWDSVDTEDVGLRVTGTTTLRADYDRLRRVFENLFRNSVEHGAPDGGRETDGGNRQVAARLTVTVSPTDRGFDVCDDGSGIPTETRDRVFERGFSTGGRGAGLGLAIVDSITAAHGWSVDVGESEGGGARFSFTTG